MPIPPTGVKNHHVNMHYPTGFGVFALSLTLDPPACEVLSYRPLRSGEDDGWGDRVANAVSKAFAGRILPCPPCTQRQSFLNRLHYKCRLTLYYLRSVWGNKTPRFPS